VLDVVTKMQKFLYSILVLGFVLSPSLTFAVSVSPTFITDPASTNFIVTCTAPYPPNVWGAYKASDGLQDDGAQTCSGSNQQWDSIFSTNLDGKYYIVETTDNPPCSNEADIADCRLDPDYVGETEICLGDNTECESGGGGTATTTDIDWGSATTTNRMLGSLNFGVTVLIVFGIIGMCGYLWNSFISNRKKPWQ